MPINPDAVGTVSEPAESSWDSSDCLLYALGVGAGITDPTGFELEFTTENTKDTEQKALPTNCVVLGGGLADGGLMEALGDFNSAMLVHGEQGITLHKPLPVAATVKSTGKIAGIYDKGKAALVILESTAVDVTDDQPIFTNKVSLFLRDEGGFGGERGPAEQEEKKERPDRDPDDVVSYTTRTDQALLYRLNGDRNPLHTDPSFSAMGGFETPILHGLCTYGFTGRGLVHSVCDGDPHRFLSMDARFSSPVIPGETLDIKVWKEDGDGVGEAFFQTCVGDRVVIDNGYMTFK